MIKTDEQIKKIAEQVSELTVEWQNEVPMVHSLRNFVPQIERDQTFLGCHLNAIVQYHLACANAAKKLAEEIARCNKKWKPAVTHPRPPRPARTKKR